MRILILFFFLLATVHALEDRQVLMDSISEHAIRIGHGPNTTYTFIDPLCPKSQNFIKLISTKKELQEETSYYIFLYELPKFDSRELIVYIYQSQDPRQALEEVMVDKDYYDIEVYETKPKTLIIMNAISKVAKQMNVKRRPYLLLFDQGSKYCRVSEGTAPCLEENDFD